MLKKNKATGGSVEFSDARLSWSRRVSPLVLLFTLECLMIDPLSADTAVRFDIAAQPLPTALKIFAEQAHMQVLYEQGIVTKAVSNAVSGDLDKRVALERLLRGTGLEVVYSEENAVTIRRSGVETKERRSKGDD